MHGVSFNHLNNLVTTFTPTQIYFIPSIPFYLPVMGRGLHLVLSILLLQPHEDPKKVSFLWTFLNTIRTYWTLFQQVKGQCLNKAFPHLWHRTPRVAAQHSLLLAHSPITKAGGSYPQDLVSWPQLLPDWDWTKHFFSPRNWKFGVRNGHLCSQAPKTMAAWRKKTSRHGSAPVPMCDATVPTTQ